MTGQEFIKKVKAHNQNRMQLNKFQHIPDFRKKQLGIRDQFVVDYFKTETEEDFLDSYYQKLTQKFIMYLPQKAKCKLENVIVGVIPSFTVNASAVVDVDCEDKIIILHTQLLAIISQFCELQILIGKNNKSAEIVKETYSQFREIVNCYVYQNYSLKLNIIHSNLQREDFELVSRQTTIIEMFVIAHELAHIYLGHCEKSSSKEISLNNNSKIKIYEHMKLMELEADRQAFEWLIEVLRNKNCEGLITFYRENEMFATEIFQLLHFIEVSTGRCDEIYAAASSVSKENEIEGRAFLILKELEDILSGCVDVGQTHPLAVVRLVNLIYNSNNEPKMQKYMLDSFWNALFFETYDIRKI